MTKTILQKQENGAWKSISNNSNPQELMDWQRKIDPHPKHWRAQYCDACKEFIQFLHIENGNDHIVLDFFTLNGVNLSAGIDYPTDSFSEWLDWDKMPKNCNVLCEPCFNHWKIPPVDGRTLIR
jgi:hypothetical protein